MLTAIKLASSLLVIILVSGCASSKQAAQQAETTAPATVSKFDDPRDPWEKLNRPLFDFNMDVLDTYLLRPATVGYIAIVPQPARKGLKNAADNLGEPASFVNSLLQAKPEKAAVSAGRFLVNSTVGVVGLFDVASRIGLENADEDFGQTLAVWGVGDGPYLMVPARGPTTVRDTTGTIVDNLYFPMSVLSTPLTITRAAIMALDAREQLMPVENMLNNSLDPYAFVKNAFFQRQRFKIYDGNPPPEESNLDDDVLDFLDDIE